MSKSLRPHLKNLENVLSESGEENYALLVSRALSGTEKDFNSFLTSNGLWGGAGSIADQAGLNQPRDEARRNIEAEP